MIKCLGTCEVNYPKPVKHWDGGSWVVCMKLDENGDEVPETKWELAGYRVVLNTGEWWFYSVSRHSWTRHELGAPLVYNDGTPVLDLAGVQQRSKERVTSYKNLTALLRDLGHCPSLITTLLEAIPQ